MGVTFRDGSGRLVRANAPRDMLLGVPGEVGSLPRGYWEQLLAPFRSGPRALAANQPAPTPQRLAQAS